MEEITEFFCKKERKNLYLFLFSKPFIVRHNMSHNIISTVQSALWKFYGAHPATCTYNGYGVFPGGKVRPGRAADHSPPSSASVMEE
jgi:hypothetical protein